MIPLFFPCDIKLARGDLEVDFTFFAVCGKCSKKVVNFVDSLHIERYKQTAIRRSL